MKKTSSNTPASHAEADRWYSVGERLPALSAEERRPGAFGRQVLIDPPFREQGAADVYVAFYGCRITDRPAFYAHGRIIPVQRWRPLPPRPSEGAAVDPEAVIKIYRSALTKIAAKRWQANATRCHPKAGCESSEIARRALDKARLLGGA